MSATVKLSTPDEHELWRAAYVAAVRAGLVSPDGNGGAGAKLADAAVEQYRQRTREERPR